MRKRHKSKHHSQFHIGSLGRRSLLRSSSKKSGDAFEPGPGFRVPKFTSYVDQYTKIQSVFKLQGDSKDIKDAVPEGIQTENTEEDEQAKLEIKLQAREDYVRANTTKVLHWLFEKTDIKDLHKNINEEEELIANSVWPGILGLLTPKEFSMIRYPEWRLVIKGNQFNILGNEDHGNSFYRALAQAVTSNEDNADFIRRQLCKHVTSTDWHYYERYVREHYLKQSPSPISTHATSAAVARLYRNQQLRDRYPGGYFQLRVAAEFYNFNFVLVFKKRSSVKWFTFTSATESGKTVAFFVWPMTSGSPLWKVLSPLDSTDLSDGEYPFFIKRTFPIQQCCYAKASHTNIQEPNEFPGVKALQLVTLQAGKEEFQFPTENWSLPQTLYSLLSEILFGNIYHAEEIRTEVLEHRDRFEYLINLNPKRKTSKKKLFASHYRQDWGDAVDLKIAASIYKFCYTVIAMDRIGNLSHISECRDRSHSHYAARHDINFLAFFTRITPRSLAWFKLELFDHTKSQIDFGLKDDNNTETEGIRSEYFTLSKLHGPSAFINNKLAALSTSENPQPIVSETEGSRDSDLE